MESSKRIKLSLSKKLKEYANKMGRDHLGGDDIPGNKKKGGLRDNDGYDNVQFNRDMPQDESVNEACWDTHKQVGMKTKGGKQVPNCVPKGESVVNEAKAKYPNFDLDKNVRYQSTSISSGMWRYTGKEQGGKGVYRNLNNGQFLGFSSDDFKYFKKHLKRHFDIDESVDEGGLPQNWMAGRVSDYHTKLRGKRRNYDDTNFAKMNTGQPDIEDEELDPDNEVVNEKFNKVEHLSLLNKALKAMPGSQNQKEIIRQLNVVRKAGGMRPLKETAIEEYGQRLDLSYILDDESVLDGTPKPKDAINKESAKKKSEKNFKDWKNTNEGSASAAQRAAIAISKKEKAGKPGYDKEGKSLKKEESKRDYKDEYKKFQSSTKSKKYRAELNKYNRDKGTYGNGDGKDASHKGGKIVGFESASKNRGRKEKSRLKKENVAPNHNDKSAPYGSGYKKVNEVGVFPIHNYIQGIIPTGYLNTNTPENKKKSVKLVGNLKKTLNTFWKQNNIPFKIK